MSTLSINRFFFRWVRKRGICSLLCCLHLEIELVLVPVPRPVVVVWFQVNHFNWAAQQTTQPKLIFLPLILPKTESVQWHLMIDHWTYSVEHTHSLATAVTWKWTMNIQNSFFLSRHPASALDTFVERLSSLPLPGPLCQSPFLFQSYYNQFDSAYTMLLLLPYQAEK